MSKPAPRRPFFERLKTGLEEGIQFFQGKIQLRTTVLPDPQVEFTEVDVMQLRQRLRLTQEAFAKVLNVSVKTVQSWEKGERKPTRTALRLLQVLDKNPTVVGKAAGILLVKPQ